MLTQAVSSKKQNNPIPTIERNYFCQPDPRIILINVEVFRLIASHPACSATLIIQESQKLILYATLISIAHRMRRGGMVHRF
jgi:hypothetical protein